jgi:hypothetical protein
MPERCGYASFGRKTGDGYCVVQTALANQLSRSITNAMP